MATVQNAHDAPPGHRNSTCRRKPRPTTGEVRHRRGDGPPRQDARHLRPRRSVPHLDWSPLMAIDLSLGYRNDDANTPFGRFFQPEMAPLPQHVVEALQHGPQGGMAFVA